MASHGSCLSIKFFSYCKSPAKGEVHTRQSDTRQAILTCSRFDCESQYPLYLPNTVSHFEVKITLWNRDVWQRGILRGPGNERDTRTSLAFPRWSCQSSRLMYRHGRRFLLMYLSISGPGGLLVRYMRVAAGQATKIHPHVPKHRRCSCHYVASPSLPLCSPLWQTRRSSNGMAGSCSSACARAGRHLGCCNALEQIRLTLLPWGDFLRNTWRHVT